MGKLNWPVFKTRKKEHLRNVKTCARGSNIAKHAWTFEHYIDFDNSQVIDKGSSRTRKTLESWHTFAIKHADNTLISTPFFFLKTPFILHCSFYYFSLALFCIYFRFVVYSILAIEGCSLAAEGSDFSFIILARGTFVNILTY